MNQSTAFRRKIIYLVILVATLVPLYLLGQPSDGTPNSGGQLAMMRDDFEISESDLGEISPASETMKLASLGLRGVAATLLWEKAHKYRVTHEWDRLKASLNNIALLQPHYDKVWEHQAHNLAYNVSIEFDDYRQRYEMVREGTEFLTRGVRQNRKAPRLIWYTGWFYGQKIGMSDEKRQFRRLFADDSVLHESLAEEGIEVDSNEALGPLGKPDNWLVGRLWLNHGYDIVDAGVKIRRQTPLNFYETGPKWTFKHAEAIEQEGILDQNAERAWTRASEEWDRFGRRSIPTTSPFTIKLGAISDLVQQRAEKAEAFRILAGKIYEDDRQAKIDALPPDTRKVLERKPEERTEAGKRALPHILASVTPSFAEIVLRLPAEKQFAAAELLSEIKDLEDRIQKTNGYRNQINYVYWESLALAEQEERTVKARRLIFEAEKANADAELDRAIELYDEAFAIWAEIFDDYPILTIDDTAEDLFASIRRYMIAIDSQDLPEDFPLKTFAELMNQGDGINDALLYEQVREQQAELAVKRQQELEEEERQREAEAAKAAKAEQMKAEEPADKPAEPASAEPTADADADAKEGEPEMKETETAAEEKPAEKEEPSAEEEPSVEPGTDAEPDDAESPAESDEAETEASEETAE
ncbi:IRE (iron responsive element) [Stieleria sp. TO1_6]|uniref:IRE (iron responsive element) n=1 Tax=Stieleria tagensis TaxID=2956795 RepID=UPI00209AD4DF|nr:IRE (iron responsive element) [Stieleria tagensis]MCO8124406.1 IRE (iron responsive element) [Stieleria tagensis]